MAFITVRHSEHGGVAEVPEEAFDVYARSGWERYDVPTDAPARSAKLKDWQDYARTVGVSEVDIEGASRQDLIEILDSIQEDK